MENYKYNFQKSSDKRLAILTASEQQSIYGLPHLSENQLTSLPQTVRTFLESKGFDIPKVQKYH